MAVAAIFFLVVLPALIVLSLKDYFMGRWRERQWRKSRTPGFPVKGPTESGTSSTPRL